MFPLPLATGAVFRLLGARNLRGLRPGGESLACRCDPGSCVVAELSIRGTQHTGLTLPLGRGERHRASPLLRLLSLHPFFKRFPAH